MDWRTIAALAGAVVVLANAGKAILGVVKPAWRFGRRVTDGVADVEKLDEWRGKAETRLERLEDKTGKDYIAIQDVQKAIKVLCAAMLALLDHEIEGNHVERLVDAKERIRDYLIER
jgi:hypothetical protein